MAGFTDAYENTVLDLAFADTDYIAWSENGTSESANLARTPVTAWAAASGGTKKPAATVTSAGATGAATISHGCVFSASVAGTQKTDYSALGEPKTLAMGDKLECATTSLVQALD